MNLESHPMLAEQTSKKRGMCVQNNQNRTSQLARWDRQLLHKPYTISFSTCVVEDVCLTTHYTLLRAKKLLVFSSPESHSQQNIPRKGERLSVNVRNGINFLAQCDRPPFQASEARCWQSLCIAMTAFKTSHPSCELMSRLEQEQSLL